MVRRRASADPITPPAESRIRSVQIDTADRVCQLFGDVGGSLFPGRDGANLAPERRLSTQNRPQTLLLACLAVVGGFARDACDVAKTARSGDPGTGRHQVAAMPSGARPNA